MSATLTTPVPLTVLPSAPRACASCGYVSPHPDEAVVGECVPGYHTLALVVAPTCRTCATTASVWSCATGTFCRLHLPINAGAIWRIGCAA